MAAQLPVKASAKALKRPVVKAAAAAALVPAPVPVAVNPMNFIINKESQIRNL